MATLPGIGKRGVPPNTGADDYLVVDVDSFEVRPGRRVLVGHHHHRGLPYWHCRTVTIQGEGSTHQQRLTFSVRTLPQFITSLLKLRHDLELRGLL